jgi:hypothetical protein
MASGRAIGGLLIAYQCSKRKKESEERGLGNGRTGNNQTKITCDVTLLSKIFETRK